MQFLKKLQTKNRQSGFDKIATDLNLHPKGINQTELLRIKLKNKNKKPFPLPSIFVLFHTIPLFGEVWKHCTQLSQNQEIVEVSQESLNGRFLAQFLD